MERISAEGPKGASCPGNDGSSGNQGHRNGRDGESRRLEIGIALWRQVRAVHVTPSSCDRGINLSRTTSWRERPRDSDPDIDDCRDTHPRNPSDSVGNGIFAIDGYERFDSEHAVEICFELSDGPDFVQSPLGP